MSTTKPTTQWIMSSCHAAPRLSAVHHCRMSKTRWVRVRVVEKKAHVRRKSTFEFEHLAGVPNCYGPYCFWIWSCGRNGVDFQCAQSFTESRRLKSVALAWYVAPFRFARHVRGTMSEKVDPLSEVGVCVLAVRLCICERSVVNRSGWCSSL